MHLSWSRVVMYGTILLISCFWPINFLLHNSPRDTIHFFLPGVLIIPILLNAPTFSPLIILASWINTSLIVAPFLSTLNSSKSILRMLFIVAAIITVVMNYKSFLGSSVFYYDGDQYQKMIRETYLYPHPYLARLFQNKPSIYIDRLLFNFFALIDPNNYFFGFHPSEIGVTNQNLQKFPFFAVVPFIVGIYQSALKKRKYLLIIGLLVINLAFLKNFDKTDAVLWIPFVWIILEGIIYLQKGSRIGKTIFLVLFFVFTLTEYLHLFVSRWMNI